MKRKVISALLACTLLAGSAVPALAAGETAAGQTPAGIGAEAPALKVRQMGVLAVKKAVQEDNSTVRILRRNASAIEGATGGSSSMGSTVSPGAAYSKLADTLEKILESGKLDGDTKKAYEAQIIALRGNAENMNLSVSVQYQSALAMLSQLDDQAYQLRRQADSIANQMAMAAQNLLYTMETLDCQMESLKNGIATLDRNLAVMKVQRSRGMIGQLQLDTVENQRVQLVNSQQTLANMREQIGLSLSQCAGSISCNRCGNAVCKDIADQRCNGAEHHQQTPEQNQPGIFLWNDIVQNIGQNPWNHQFHNGSYKLEENSDSHSGDIGFDVANNWSHGCLSLPDKVFCAASLARLVTFSRSCTRVSRSSSLSSSSRYSFHSRITLRTQGSSSCIFSVGYTRQTLRSSISC